MKCHPWVIACAIVLLTKQVILTQKHLAIAMEFAAGGELFDRIVKAGRFSENEARYYFQQLVNGIEYCHKSVMTNPQEIRSWTLLKGSGPSRSQVGKHAFRRFVRADSQNLRLWLFKSSFY